MPGIELHRNAAETFDFNQKLDKSANLSDVASPATARLNLSAQLASANLDAWSAITTASKQAAAANLTSWAAIAPATKQDVTANLTAWSAIATSTKQNAAANLDLWAAITPAGSYQAADTEIDTAKLTVVADRTALKAQVAPRTYLHNREAYRIGDWIRVEGDQSAHQVVSTLSVVADAGADTLTNPTLSVPNAGSIDTINNVLTFSTNHGRSLNDRMVQLSATGNGITQFADYRAIVAGLPDNQMALAANSVAATNNLRVDITGTTGTPLSFGLAHDLQSGDGVVFPTTAPTGLTVGQKYYAIYNDLVSIKVATSHANAIAGTAINLTGGGTHTMLHVVDTEEARFITKASDPMSGVSGAWRRSVGETHITPEMCGADPTGAVASSAAIQQCFNYARRKRLPIVMNGYARYLMDKPIYLRTTKTAHYTNQDLGIYFVGRGRQNIEFQLDPSFPDGAYLFNFDANPHNLSEPLMAVEQGFHTIGGFAILGTGLADPTNKGAIRYRGIDGMKMDDIYFYACSGVGIYHDGTTVAGKDDVDTSHNLSFNNIKFENMQRHGFLGSNNRAGNVKFDQITARLCQGGGIAITCAGLTVLNSQFADCGKTADTTSGGLLVAVSATAAVGQGHSRGLFIAGSLFENNAWHDIMARRGFALNVIGNSFHPYENNSGQAIIDLVDASGAGDLRGANIIGNRVQAKTGGTFQIPWVRTNSTFAGRLEMMGNEIADEFGAGMNATPHAIHVNTSAFRNGVPIQHTSERPRFYTRATAGADIDNQTGDGTEVVGSVLATSYVEAFDTAAAVSTGRFTAPVAGLYHFNASVAVDDMDTSVNLVELYLIKNLAGSPERYYLHREVLVSPTAARKDYSGSAQLYLAAGDTVEWGFKASGGAKTVDFVRVANPDSLSFSGHLVV